MEQKHTPAVAPAPLATIEKPLKVEVSTQNLVLQPVPLKLEIDTSTDWVAVGATALVGLGSIVTAAVVAYITRANQISQNKAHTANLRQKWQEELRDAVSEYMAILMLAQFVSEKHAADTSEFKEAKLNHTIALMKVHSKIILMLDKKQNYSKEIEQLMATTATLHKENKRKEMAKSMGVLLDKFRDVLEKTWGDIKTDLNA